MSSQWLDKTKIKAKVEAETEIDLRPELTCNSGIDLRPEVTYERRYDNQRYDTGFMENRTP